MATKKPPRGAFGDDSRCLRPPRLLLRIHADFVAAAVLVLELHYAIDQRVDGEIGAEADVASRMPLGPALAQDDVAGDDFLPAELLHATESRIAIATVSR